MDERGNEYKFYYKSLLGKKSQKNKKNFKKRLHNEK